MARKPDLPCSICGKLMWSGTTSLPAGQATCQPCRRATTTAKLKAEPRQWNCAICGVSVTGARAGKYCKQHGRGHWDNDKGHRRRARKYGVHYEYINPRTIFVRDRWMCGLCGKRVDRALTYPHRMSASLDHLVPISRGGPHEPANVQCSHLACNMAKRDGGCGEQLALVG